MKRSTNGPHLVAALVVSGAFASAGGLACRRGEDAPKAGGADARQSAGDEADEPPREPVADWPRRAASLREIENTRKALQALVRDGATDPKEPWAMSHGIVAFGPDLKANDARLAVDAIVSDYLRSREEDGRTVWYFPDQTPEGRPLEPHDNLIVKLLVTSGLPESRTFTIRGGKDVTLKELVKSMEATFEKPSSAHDWGRQAWTLEALFTANEPGTRLELDGWTPTFTELVLYAVEGVGRLQAFLEEPMKNDRPERVEKRKQGIYAHTCGGLHFVQAAVRGANRLGAEAPLAKAREQLDIARFRFDAERRIYRQTILDAPKYRTLILVQEMKFHGHLLETFGLAAEWGAITPTPELSQFIREVAGDLIDAVRELDSAYAEIDEYRRRASQTYYDLIGDGCHAIRGLRLAAEHFIEAEE